MNRFVTNFKFFLIFLFLFACSEESVKDNSEIEEYNKKKITQPQKVSAVKDMAQVTSYNSSRQYYGLGAENEQIVDYNTESYDVINENQFKSSVNNPLSTFSIDVDAASYSNVRRFITNNSLPPIDAVRIEELINYFDYDYPQPTGDDPFSINTELSECPWNENHMLVHIGLQGKTISLDKLPPSNIVFLLDVSGSMDSPSKLPLLKKAFNLLLKQLRENDRVAIVVYAGAAGVVLKSTLGNEKEIIIQALDKLQAGGSTAGGEGIQLAYKIAAENFIDGGNNRIVLATDGDFNIGASSDAEMVRLIEKEREKGIFLTVLGFGMGNYKDSKMEKLADKGNGNYAYLDNIMEAKKVLVNEFGGTMFTIAKDVKIQVEFNPAKVKAYRLIGYENRIMNNEDFNDDKKDAGELGAGHTVTALYEIIPADSDEKIPGIDDLKYQNTNPNDFAQNTNEIMTVKLRYKQPNENTSKLLETTISDDNFVSLDNAGDNFMFAAAISQFGMLLRNSEFKGTSTFENTIEFAKKSAGTDKNGYRKDFIRMAEAAALLYESQTL